MCWKLVNQNHGDSWVWILHASQEHYERWSRTQFFDHIPFDWYSPFRAVQLEFWRKRDKCVKVNSPKGMSV